MPILIDGWNLIRNRRSDIADDEGESIESVQQLIAYLTTFQRTHRDPIIVVLDSSREHIDSGHKNNAGLTIIPSRNADAYIKRYLDKTPEAHRRNIRVVSSDNSVYYYAKSCYATPIRAEDFWDKLHRSI